MRDHRPDGCGTATRHHVAVCPWVLRRGRRVHWFPWGSTAPWEPLRGCAQRRGAVGRGRHPDRGGAPRGRCRVTDDKPATADAEPTTAHKGAELTAEHQ